MSNVRVVQLEPHEEALAFAEARACDPELRAQYRRRYPLLSPKVPGTLVQPLPSARSWTVGLAVYESAFREEIEDAIYRNPGLDRARLEAECEQRLACARTEVWPQHFSYGIRVVARMRLI